MNRQAVRLTGLVAVVFLFAAFWSGPTPVPQPAFEPNRRLAENAPLQNGAEAEVSKLAGTAATPVRDSESPSTRPTTSTLGRALVILKSREHLVTVYAGQRFAVTSRTGEVLAANLSVVELRLKYPLLYEYYRTSYAEVWAEASAVFR